MRSEILALSTFRPSGFKPLAGLNIASKRVKKIRGYARMLVEHLRHIDRSMRRACLAVIGCISPKQRCLPPIEAGVEDQSVKPVIGGGAAPDSEKSVLEVFPPRQKFCAGSIRDKQIAIVKINGGCLPTHFRGQLKGAL